MSGNDRTITYQDLYYWLSQQILSRFEADQLFAHVTGKKAHLLPRYGEKPAPPQEQKLLQSLCRRRRKGEPLQYLLGEWEFYSLPFKVGRGVLIPRADTETLVDAGLELMKGIPSPELLDLCSGTGCVAVALAHHLPGASVTALEVSPHAFRYLTHNITLNKSPVRAVHEDLREYVHPRPLDLLTANPPYIPKGELEGLQAELWYEPRQALDGGTDGLGYYHHIAGLYREQVKPGGWICLEVGIGQSAQVARILENAGFEEIGERPDLAGIPRVVLGRRR